MNSPRSRRRGFTLVEIMVVVVIVGILSSLSIAGIIRVKHKTQATLVFNTLRQFYDAKELYFTQEGKAYATYAILAKQDYISHSMAAATEHDIGAWSTTALRVNIYKPGVSIKLLERSVSGNRVTFGRQIEYPGSQP